MHNAESVSRVDLCRYPLLPRHPPQQTRSACGCGNACVHLFIVGHELCVSGCFFFCSGTVDVTYGLTRVWRVRCRSMPLRKQWQMMCVFRLRGACVLCMLHNCEPLQAAASAQHSAFITGFLEKALDQPAGSRRPAEYAAALVEDGWDNLKMKNPEAALVCKPINANAQAAILFDVICQ